MLFSSQRVLFSCLFIIGTITALSFTSWFMAWIGLELNLMSFVPLISSKQNQFPSEAALKYFLIQALGSAMIIFASPLTLDFPAFTSTILLALLLKLGAAPFHFWFPAIMEGLNWIQAIMLMTIQKIAPMFLISHLSNTHVSQTILLITAMMSALVGYIGGLNQTSLRKILPFSSINHISWMLVTISINESSWILYFIFYTMISSYVALLFNFQQSFYFPQLLSQMPNLPYWNVINSFSLLSLGGLPPFSGFLPKLILIESMCYSKLFIPLFLLIFSALITLYYYLRLSITYMLFLSTKPKSSPNTQYQSSYTPTFVFFNLFLLFIPPLFILF